MTGSSANCPKCGGESQVEETRRRSTWYVRRLRGCVDCGVTWSTAEIPLPMLKRTMKVEAFIEQLRG